MTHKLWGALPVAGLVVVALSGCQSLGPAALERSHPAYSQAIINTVNQEMLENIVRLRYRDAPLFLRISSVTNSVGISASTNVGAYVPLQGSGESLSPSLSLSYSNSPTLSYQPLQGQDLLKNVYSALQPEAVFVLTELGWAIDQVLGLCVERVNYLFNAPQASGPTPQDAPHYIEFVRMMEILSSLHQSQLVELGRREVAVNGGNKEVILIKLNRQAGRKQGEVDELYELLNLDADVDEFQIDTNMLDLQREDNTHWYVQPRSVAGLLNYLSHSVAAPELHETAALVTTTMTGEERVFDWSDTPAGRMFKVYSSEERPHNAYISTHYRGHWFYIRDDDLNTKSTFMLVRQLFDLQSGQTQGYGPTLTLPVR